MPPFGSRLPPLRVPRAAPSRTTPVHIFPPRILEIAGPRGRKGAGVCLLTELGGRSRDAAKAAVADDGSLRTKVRQFLSDPWTRKTPQPGPGPCKTGRQQEPRRWRRARAVLELLFLLLRLSLGPTDQEGPQGWSRARAGSILLR